MESKSYQYSLNNLVARLIWLGIMLYLALRPFLAEHAVFWIYLKKAMVLFIIYLIVESIIKYAIPLVRKKYAIELSDRCLCYRIKNKTVGWSDIKEIEPSPWGISSLKIILNNGKKFRVRTDEIRGSDNEIYQDIMAYFKKSKAQPEPI